MKGWNTILLDATLITLWITYAPNKLKAYTPVFVLILNFWLTEVEPEINQLASVAKQFLLGPLYGAV